VLNFDFESHLSVATSEVIWDIANATVVQLNEEKHVVTALRGFKALSTQEIANIYGEPPIFGHLCWPQTTQKLESEKDAHWIFTGKS
jgi:hypothetical protein